MAQVNNNNDIKYLTPIAVDTKRKKYCRFKKNRIKYIDYKDADFLLKFVNEQGKILPRRITGTSSKYQRKVESFQWYAVICGNVLRCLYFLVMLLSVEYRQCPDVFFAVFFYGESKTGSAVKSAAQ